MLLKSAFSQQCEYNRQDDAYYDACRQREIKSEIFPSYYYISRQPAKRQFYSPFNKYGSQYKKHPYNKQHSGQ
jgi:hypothetical protein